MQNFNQTFPYICLIDFFSYNQNMHFKYIMEIWSINIVIMIKWVLWKQMHYNSLQIFESKHWFRGTACIFAVNGFNVPCAETQSLNWISTIASCYCWFELMKSTLPKKIPVSCIQVFWHTISYWNAENISFQTTNLDFYQVLPLQNSI